MRLKQWQWIVLLIPIVTIISFIMIAAGWQIHNWGINWIWAVFIFMFLGVRWLLVIWTKKSFQEIESAIADVQVKLDRSQLTIGNQSIDQIETVLNQILQKTQTDPQIWEDWSAFFQRCQEVVTLVAKAYYPDVKDPLLNIYVPQVYGLIRGTVDDLDRWMEKLSPVLNQVTVGQAYQAYQVYQKLEPSARKLWQIWNWSQWVLNPAAAVAKQASQKPTQAANQQLLINLGQSLREAALKNLCNQAIALYGGQVSPIQVISDSNSPIPKAKTTTLKEILAQAEKVEDVEKKAINILLVGRTGAGKSSLINSLFNANLAEVDVLPSTDQIKSYHWQSKLGENLTLWDTPGYEQVNQPQLRKEVLNYAHNADLLLLVTPCLDPALQMDLDFIKEIKAKIADLPTLAVVTQVDRLRPLREWQPPYNWQSGDRPKEINIREALEYRYQSLKDYCSLALPVVTEDSETKRIGWGIDSLSLALMNQIDPAKKLRIIRFFKNLEARTIAAAKIIDHYTFQMTTTQGLTALLKSPILRFISVLTTGSPTLAYLLAEQIPIEELPVVIGKLQMAYELFTLLNPDNINARNFELLTLWPLLLEKSQVPEKNAWAFGHALVEYWSQGLTVEQLQKRFEFYLKSS
jgi:uncharacterized protein